MLKLRSWTRLHKCICSKAASQILLSPAVFCPLNLASLPFYQETQPVPSSAVLILETSLCDDPPFVVVIPLAKVVTQRNVHYHPIIPNIRTPMLYPWSKMWGSYSNRRRDFPTFFLAIWRMRGDRQVDADVDGIKSAVAAECVSKLLLYHNTIKERMIIAHGQTLAFLCCSMQKKRCGV